MKPALRPLLGFLAFFLADRRRHRAEDFIGLAYLALSGDGRQSPGAVKICRDVAACPELSAPRRTGSHRKHNWDLNGDGVPDSWVRDDERADWLSPPRTVTTIGGPTPG